MVDSIRTPTCLTQVFCGDFGSVGRSSILKTGGTSATSCPLQTSRRPNDRNVAMETPQACPHHELPAFRFLCLAKFLRTKRGTGMEPVPPMRKIFVSLWLRVRKNNARPQLSPENNLTLYHGIFVASLQGPSMKRTVCRLAGGFHAVIDPFFIRIKDGDISSSSDA